MLSEHSFQIKFYMLRGSWGNIIPGWWPILFHSSLAMACSKAHRGEKPHVHTECETHMHTHSHTYWNQTAIEIKEFTQSYEWNECRKVLYWKPYLIVLQRIHAQEKPFEWHEDGKAFHQKLALISHQKVHREETLWMQWQWKNILLKFKPQGAWNSQNAMNVKKSFVRSWILTDNRMYTMGQPQNSPNVLFI